MKPLRGLSENIGRTKTRRELVVLPPQDGIDEFHRVDQPTAEYAPDIAYRYCS